MVEMAMTNPGVSKSTRDGYRNLLRSFRQDRCSDPIANRRPWHCEEAIQELLLLAQGMQRERRLAGEAPVIIRILTSVCPDHVYGRTAYDAFQEFAELGGKVRVIALADRAQVGEPRLTQLQQHYPERFELKNIEAAGLPIDDICHFFLVEAIAYRLEAPHKMYPAECFNDFEPEIPARINFNDPDLGGRLKDIFEILWKNQS